MAKEIDCRLKINKELASCKGKQLIVEKSKKRKPAIKQGTLSLLIGSISLLLAVTTIFTKPSPIPVENMSIFGGSCVLYIPLIAIFVVIAVVSFITYFARRNK